MNFNCFIKYKQASLDKVMILSEKIQQSYITEGGSKYY